MNLYSIMGPTGAGKSSFIEALAGESQQLSISKNQLAGYTQTVHAYRLVNVVSTIYMTPRPVYLIDTPGFSDSKISEKEIMDMVRKWMKDNHLEFVNRILFLTPITETRLPGSRRKTIEMLKQLLAPSRDLGAVIFVTTMWDTLHNERTQKRAESNFAQLRDEVCKVITVVFCGPSGVTDCACIGHFWRW
ncbi:P-loop containing nucleoside triphosphate hydrolase protein [Panaeolus papilionaceus]|nr:P-loop containing nucleoside triphosphate hydrolase protein [Panaeolus papilionaceus]